MRTCFFQLSSGRLAYSIYGTSGQPVVMLPGMGALRSEYRFLGPRLDKAGFRAIALDLRGHGDSSVPWTRYDVPSVGGDILHLVDHVHEGPVHQHRGTSGITRTIVRGTHSASSANLGKESFRAIETTIRAIREEVDNGDQI